MFRSTSSLCKVWCVAHPCYRRREHGVRFFADVLTVSVDGLVGEERVLHKARKGLLYAARGSSDTAAVLLADIIVCWMKRECRDLFLR